MNARALGLAGLAAAMALGVVCLLRVLGRGDAEPPIASTRERSGRGAPGLLDALAGRVLRPGALSPAHAHLEGARRCTACHGRASHAPDARCEACHEEIALRAGRALPLHGTFQGPCASCHPEHAGASTRLIDLDRDAFAHGTTRFPLRGAHARAECADCHELATPDGNGTRFRYQGVPFASCADCHIDPHAGGTASGRTVQPLVQVALDAPPRSALPRDPSHPLAGRDCASCHTEAGFRSAQLRSDGFAHEIDTHFALRGVHAGLACSACHTQERRERERRNSLAPGRGAEPACGSCHEDPHHGALGSAKRCERCHTSERWNAGFDHAADTRFVLDPLHAALRCESCHADLRYRAAGRTCEACHTDASDLLAGRFGERRAAADPHDGALGCADCHGPTRAANLPAALAARCADCHDATYAPLLATWRARLDQAALEAPADEAAIERLRRGGPHNFPFALELLTPRRETR